MLGMHLTQWMQRAKVTRPYICGYFFSTPGLFRAQDGMVEMTPKPLILRLLWLVMHKHVWIENKVGVGVKTELEKTRCISFKELNTIKSSAAFSISTNMSNLK